MNPETGQVVMGKTLCLIHKNLRARGREFSFANEVYEILLAYPAVCIGGKRVNLGQSKRSGIKRGVGYLDSALARQTRLGEADVVVFKKLRVMKVVQGVVVFCNYMSELVEREDTHERQCARRSCNVLNDGEIEHLPMGWSRGNPAPSGDQCAVNLFIGPDSDKSVSESIHSKDMRTCIRPMA